MLRVPMMLTVETTMDAVPIINSSPLTSAVCAGL
jgi:hypothetical protein